MKAKVLLMFLPALMVLSSCGSATQPSADNGFLEDTTAHSELFGNSEEELPLLNKQERAAGEAISAPRIGYQIKYDSSTDKIAIRFIAAIKEFNVDAYWRRGVAAPDGTTPQSKDFSDDGQKADKYYVTLSDGVTTYRAGEGEWADYSGFVVYTMHNIPYTANKDSYVAAYVNLVGNEEGEDVHNNSLALAVKIEKKTNYSSNNVFAFNPLMDHRHFLQGKINNVIYDGGANGLYEESGNTPGDDYAWYENVALKADDYFGSFYYNHDEIFQYFGYSTYSDGTDYFEQASLSGYNSPKYDGTYSLHVSSDSSHGNHLYAKATSIAANTKFTIRLEKGCKWDIDSAWFAVYMFNDNSNHWEKMDSSNPSYYELTNFDPNVYTGFIVCRMKKENTTLLDWSNKNNQSRNLYLNDLAGLTSYFKLAVGDPWDNNSYDYFSVN